MQLQIYKKYLHKYFANNTFIGKQIVYLPSCHSTNDIAAKMVPERQLLEGGIVITDEQTSGKGQRGNSWEAAKGQNLTFSVMLKPSFLSLSSQFYLNILSSLAIADTLFGYVSEGLAIKWPNDIYVGQAKLGGILIENTIRGHMIEHSIIGIGLNINQRDFTSPKASSMALVCGRTFILENVLAKLLGHLERRYLQLKNHQHSRLKAEYLEKLYWRDQKRTFKDNDYFIGTIRGIDEIGQLIIETASGVRKFGVKEVRFVE